jgi:hypothetical protein
MDPVQTRGPRTGGPCFVLSREKTILESASYKQVFYSILFMLYLISHKIGRLNLSLTIKCTLFVKKTAFCWGFLV